MWIIKQIVLFFLLWYIMNKFFGMLAEGEDEENYHKRRLEKWERKNKHKYSVNKHGR